MASSIPFNQIRERMEMLTADGTKLGKIKNIWIGTDPVGSSILWDEEVCSRLEVHHGFLNHRVLYIPYNAIADVSGSTVQLNIDAAAADEKEDWHHKPRWIAVA